MKTSWPVLSYPEEKETCETVHLWLQILGKIKLARLPWVNHSWHVALTVTARGISTGSLPHDRDHFEIDLNLADHRLDVRTSSGLTRSFSLDNLAVADFYRKIFTILDELEIPVSINRMPNEIADAIPFDEDYRHATYDHEHASRLHRALLLASDILMQFRAAYSGKCSPVHLFWGSFDLAVSRFSGRTAPPHPGGVPHLPDWVAREAYSHEVSSCGFWFGDSRLPFAAFYAYFYPEPAGLKNARIEPREARYDENLGEFILPYEAVRQAADPGETVLAFLRSTFNAGARLAEWDRVPT